MSSAFDLNEVFEQKRIRSNYPVPRLVESAILRNEGYLTDSGALRVATGKYTGRSPNDKFFVKDFTCAREINWSPINQAMNREHFDVVLRDVVDYLSAKDIYIFDGFAGADTNHRIAIRVINELAWQNLFIRQLLIRPDQQSLKEFQPDFHIICAPGFMTDRERHGSNSEATIALDLTRKIIIIAGTSYAGEIKKAVFTLMNYLLPKQNILSMHCSVNMGKDEDDVALFFGLSGTGKTSLSTDPGRRLVGDDEHGWSSDGIFNIEGGCYAKCIGLNPEDEPQIWNAIRFGAVLENVVVDRETGIPDFKSDKITENTRAGYPVEYIPNPVIPGLCGHPRNIFFLAADAFGVLPPIARLNRDQAMYHFLSGYTSKLAGTERGIQKPQATFSECFGAPFLPHPPVVYANLLGEKLKEHPATRVYLVNTGWSGGPYGVGSRFKIAYTRAIIRAVLEGELNKVSYRIDPVFGFEVPMSCSGVPAEILIPRNTWPNPKDYDAQAHDLALRFHENFRRFNNLPQSILNVSPCVEAR